MRRPVPWRLPGAGRSAEETPIPRYTLEAIIIVLLVLWLLGWLILPLAGHLIHLLIIIILVVVLIRLLRRRGPRL